jgi:ketosteroid isomerase-like protein
MSHEADQITELENRFWNTMVDKDVDAAKAMIAEECLVTGPSGAMKIDPERYGKMAADGQWRLDTFEFRDVEVIFPSDDVAVIAYKVHQQGELKGEPMDLNCADSSTWVRRGSEWKCALHTEAIVGYMPSTN